MMDGDEKDPVPLVDALGALIASTRAIATASDDDIRAAELRAERAERARRLKFSGIWPILDDRARRALVESSEAPSVALSHVQRWYSFATHPTDPARQLLVLLGPMGIGKSVAAGWVLARETGMYTTVERLLRLYTSRGREPEAELERYRRARFVVLDELGTERDEEGWRACFHWLVDGRQARKLTLIMGNMSPEQFRARLGRAYDERTADRLRAIGRLVSVEGASMRGGSL